jgi:hypothetical protein
VLRVDARPEAAGVGWKTIAREQNGFYTVLDGLCAKLGVGRVGTDLVVHYGGGVSMLPSLGDRRGLASFIALRESGLEAIGEPEIRSPTGIAGRSLEDFWIADSTDSRFSLGAVLHRRVGTTWKRYEKDQTDLHVWLGGIIGRDPGGTLWSDGASAKPPWGLTAGVAPYMMLSAFPTGELAVIGGRDVGAGPRGEGWVARQWSPTTKIKHTVLSMLDADAWGSLVEVAPDELYV